MQWEMCVQVQLGVQWDAKGFVVLLTLGIAVVVLGQTSADVSAKYRQVTSYELRPTS